MTNSDPRFSAGTEGDLREEISAAICQMQTVTDGTDAVMALIANQSHGERMWCLACGTVTRDGICDCNRYGQVDHLPNFVNYADELSRECQRLSNRLETERNELQNSYGEGPVRDGAITRRIAEIDKELACLALSRPHGGGE